MHAMLEVIGRHPAAQRLLNLPSDSEVVAVWIDRETGELCKCKIDRLLKDRTNIIDLKSTKDPSPSGFEGSVLDYGYHRQGAFYSDGVHTLTEGQYPGFYLITQEKTKPYEVVVYLLDDAAVDYGRYQYTKLLRAYSEAMLTNEWPGYSKQVQIIGLPAWAASKARQEMEAHDAAF
jgi:exodeoxyribonuclease VIII